LGFGWWKFAWEFRAAQDDKRGCCCAAWFIKVVLSEGRIGKVTCLPCIFTTLLLYTNDEKQSLF
jgi:hypothetical protein